MTMRPLAAATLLLMAVACGNGLTASYWQGVPVNSSNGNAIVSSQPRPAALRIQASTNTTTAGNLVNVTVTALDAGSNILTAYAGTLAFSSSDPNAAMPKDYTFSGTDRGRHTFSLALITSGSQWVQAEDAQAATTVRQQLVVVAAAPTGLAFADYPRRTSPGADGNVTLVAVDAFGNVAPSFVGTVTFSSSDTKGTVPPMYTYQVADAGSHTFAHSVSFAASGIQLLTAGSPSVNAVTQKLLVVAPSSVPEHAALSNCQLHDASVKCWGNNAYGNLGLGDLTDRGSAPGQMGSSLPFVDLHAAAVLMVAVGERHTCALLSGGVVKCWGDNTDGKLGYGLNSNANYGGSSAYPMGASLPQVDLPLPALMISAGYFHTCALLADYSVRCWGRNTYGQLGQGSTADIGTAPEQISSAQNSPSAVALGGRAIALSSGYAHTCALMDDFSLKCWGYNYLGQLGLGDQNNRGDVPGTMGAQLPTVSLGTHRYAVTIAAQQYGTCALLDNGSVKCWGFNGVGQLGLGDQMSRGTDPRSMGDQLPAIDFDGHQATSLTSGYTHSCVILDDGSARCWGSNGSGELGLGDLMARGYLIGQMGASLPAPELGTNRSVTAFSLGSDTSCALLDNGSTKCWGLDLNGQNGLGDTLSRGTSSSQLGDGLPAVQLF